MVACEHFEFGAKPEVQDTDVMPVTLPTPTLSDAEALIVPSPALIVTVPAFPLLVNPELVIVATEVEDEVHVTEFVRFCVLPSV